MVKKQEAVAESNPGTLVKEILEQGETLFRQQVELFRSEVAEQLGKAGGAAAAAGAGAGLLAGGGVLSTLALVHLLHQSTRLPLWACYGLVAAGLGAAGVGLLALARQKARDLELGLPQTAEGLKENLTWLKEQVTAGG